MNTSLRCPRCSHLNPAEAAYCYFDGFSLGVTAAPIDPARQRFTRPFFFSENKECFSFDELVLACLDDWDKAKQLVARGALANFFTSLGRRDLARVARKAQADLDGDASLDELLRELPSTLLQPPKLVVRPLQFNLGELAPGQSLSRSLELENAGMGLLRGSITSNVPWLQFSQGGNHSPRKVFQFLHETNLTLHIPPGPLRGSNKPYEGLILLETNGGRVEVPVTFTVPVRPFDQGVLKGATTPRRLAELAKDRPREAGDLFASGAIEQWYRSNGWDYPVPEPASTGVARVQQYFEALGFSKPVRVSLEDDLLLLRGPAGGEAVGELRLVTEEKRPIWVVLHCDAPWLDIRDIDLRPRLAVLRLGSRNIPGNPEDQHTSQVIITTNGRVKHKVTVRLTVQGKVAVPVPPMPIPPVPGGAPPVPVPALPPIPGSISTAPVRATAVSAPPPPPVPSTASSRPLGNLRTWALALAPLAMVTVGLFSVAGRDLLTLATPSNSTHVLGGTGRPEPELDPATLPVVVDLRHDSEPRTESREINLGGRSQTIRIEFYPRHSFGLLHREGLFGQKKLTFDEQGRSNNTVISLNGREHIFGAKPPLELTTQTRLPGEDYGEWVEVNGTPEARLQMLRGKRAIWRYPRERVEIVQSVGLIPGEQSRQIDTCLVHYQIRNRDNQPHRIGLRFLLDTYIGTNDGVPFLIPGQDRLINQDFTFVRPETVPDFIQALERQDLANPGTIAQIGLRLQGMPPPDRVQLSAWPDNRLGGACKDNGTLWTVPLHPIHQLNDSAVVLYWEPRPLLPGQSREMAFTYGLGQVAGKSDLALTVGGSFVPGGEFTLTAYVRDPKRNENLSLELPPGFTLVQGRSQAPVPPLPADRSTRVSPVTWKIRAGVEGSHTLRVRSSTGNEQSQPIRIKARNIFGS
jgi:hypothetical protein